MYTVFCISDTVSNTKFYLLKDWGSAEPDQVAAWDDMVLTGIGGAPVYDFDVDNLKWSGKPIMNSISLYILDYTEKYLGVWANGPATYSSAISNIQQVRLSAIRNLVYEIRKMSLIKEPGQKFDTFGSQVIKKTRRIVGSGSSPSNITSIVALQYTV